MKKFAIILMVILFGGGFTMCTKEEIATLKPELRLVQATTPNPGEKCKFGDQDYITLDAALTPCSANECPNKPNPMKQCWTRLTCENLGNIFAEDWAYVALRECGPCN